jgi:hypothetical protein
MRIEAFITPSAADRRRLESIAADCNTPRPRLACPDRAAKR